jgi:hypothetical protein
MVASTKIEYGIANITDINVHCKTDEKTGKRTITSIEIGDERHESSQRFWTSLFARYGFSNQFFKYYDHDEVFERIKERTTVGDSIRTCIEERTAENGNRISKILGVSNPRKPLVPYDDMVDLLDRYGCHKMDYHEGEIHSTHTPRIGSGNFDVCGDAFNNQFMISTPIDGYGSPNFYLSLLRQICTNGVVGFAPAFKSSLQLGKTSDDVMPTILRALDSFNNDEGFAALRQRIEASSKSWASMKEALDLYKLLIRAHNSHEFTPMDSGLSAGTNLRDLVQAKGGDGISLASLADHSFPLLTAFHRMTGDINELYGIANTDAITVKRQRMLPVRCKVYDLLNFATEAATHYSSPAGARRLNGFVGSLISDEYDMENTVDEVGEFDEFLIRGKLAAGVTG